MTPSDIEVLIHFHCMAADHPRAEAPAVRRAIQNFFAIGVLEARKGRIQTTAKGAAWLRALCNVPCPTAQWVDEHGRVLSE